MGFEPTNLGFGVDIVPLEICSLSYFSIQNLSKKTTLLTYLI
jgi:hypothetical protein